MKAEATSVNIQDFARHYKTAGYPQNPALMRRVYLTDISSSTLVWDEGEFLVELYFMHPHSIAVPHHHPFESCVIHLGGSLQGSRESAFGDWMTDADTGKISRTLEAGDWHAFTAGEFGAVVYSIGRFINQADKDSATLKYTGKPLGPIHKATLDLQKGA